MKVTKKPSQASRSKKKNKMAKKPKGEELERTGENQRPLAGDTKSL